MYLLLSSDFRKLSVFSYCDSSYLFKLKNFFVLFPEQRNLLIYYYDKDHKNVAGQFVRNEKCKRGGSLWIGRHTLSVRKRGRKWETGVARECRVETPYLRNFKLNCDVFKLTFLPQPLTGTLTRFSLSLSLHCARLEVETCDITGGAFSLARVI